MRRIAVALVLLLAAACDSESGEMCVEPTTVERPVMEGGSWAGNESQCQFVAYCMGVLECSGTDCAIRCMENVFGSDDCGCCGDACEDTCSQVLDVAIASRDCTVDGGGYTAKEMDACQMTWDECGTLGFQDRELD